jgi:hypothetical protein
MSEVTQPEARGTDQRTDEDPVRGVQRDFPHYRIWREMAGAREPRYVAQARSLGARLHIVMTPDLSELRNALETAPAQLVSAPGRGPLPRG